MAEKKEHNYVSAATNEVTEKPQYVAAKPVGNAKSKRLVAVILWVVAFVFEILAALVLFGKLNLKFIPTLWQLIIFLVLDLICVVIGSQFWKQANRIDPASEKNKLKFWLWNNMGVIAAAFCFIPFIILVLTNKDIDKKSKTIATVAAAVLLVGAELLNYDWNPVSSEMKDAAVNEFGSATVYWAPFGKVYHTHTDCQALNQSDTLTYGTVEEAIAANRSRLCKFCAKQDNISDVATDD